MSGRPIPNFSKPSDLSDLGNGYLDGANLVANFENLNPANTLWAKQYNVYANVDTEEERFLKFVRRKATSIE